MGCGTKTVVAGYIFDPFVEILQFRLSMINSDVHLIIVYRVPREELHQGLELFGVHFNLFGELFGREGFPEVAVYIFDDFSGSCYGIWGMEFVYRHTTGFTHVVKHANDWSIQYWFGLRTERIGPEVLKI